MGSSVYTFFFEKALKGKPDAYSLVSCAAFAIMSLSLSRQTHCGFEVDLLHFFLGCLFLLLTKIHLLLAIFGGGGFAYFLTMLRCSLDAQPEDVNLDQIVINPQQANTDSALSLGPEFCEPPIKSQFKDCIMALMENSRDLFPLLISHVHEYLKANVAVSIPVPQLQSDSNLVVDALQSKIINDLHETVKLMVATGFEEECCHVYSNCCGQFLQECILAFELQDTEVADKMERIQRWIKASNIAFRILFPNERTLCDRIFFWFSPAADLSFMEVCRELMFHLLNFANTCAIGSLSQNLLHGSLTVFDALGDLISEFESLFSNQYSVSLMNEAITIRGRLGAAIRGVFMELDTLIRFDTALAAVPHGGIHPITRDVMNCLCVVIKGYPADRKGTASSLSFQMASIIVLLERNLEAKSKSYTDPALGYVFMMNNGTYIKQIAKFVGNEWVEKYAAKVRQSWDKVLDFLKLDNNESVESMKEKLNLFNMHFKEIRRVQSTWFVYDKQLREEIIISLENILLQSYGKFIGRFQDVLGEHAYEYIRYGMVDISDLIKDLFCGNK